MIIKNSKIPKLLSFFIEIHAITIWPFIFISDSGDPDTILHEKIHLRQQVELGIFGFYFLYAFFYFYFKLKNKNNLGAYYSIPFEKEAYAATVEGESYLRRRLFLSWINFL
jgi:hypothetical protein